MKRRAFLLSQLAAIVAARTAGAPAIEATDRPAPLIVGGWLTRNEARAREGLDPPLPDALA